MQNDQKSAGPLSWAQVFPWLDQYVQLAVLGGDEKSIATWNSPIDEGLMSTPAFQNAVASELLSHFGHWEIGQLFTAIPVELDVFALAESVRLSNVLGRNGIVTFERLEALTVADLMGFRNVGFTTISELIGVLFRAEVNFRRRGSATDTVYQAKNDARNLPRLQILEQEPHESEIVRSIRVLANWAASNQIDKFGLFAPELDTPDAPRAVRDALEYIGALSIFEWAEPTNSISLADRLEHFAAGLDVRELAIAKRRIIAPKQETLEMISTEFNVSRERVRQIEASLLSKIGDLFAESGDFENQSAAIRKYLNPIASVERILADIDGLNSQVGSLGQPVWLVFDKFDNSIESDGIWIAKPSLDSVASDFQLQFDQFASESGLIRLEELRLPFSEWTSLDDAELMNYAKSLGYFEFLGHLASPRISTLPDKLHAYFETTGSPASAEEINDALGASHALASLKNALASDHRFLRVGKRNWGLRDWDIAEFTTIRDQILECIKNDGPTPIDVLVQKMTGQFEVSPRSVTVYASSWPLQILNGIVQFASEPPTPKRTFAETKGLFKCGEAVIYRFQLTRDHLRGSGMSIPAALAQSIGLELGERISLESAAKDIAFSWVSAQPAIGSIRSLLGELDSEVGDLVFIHIEKGRISLHLGQKAEKSLNSKVMALIGIPDSGEDLSIQISRSIGIGQSSGWGGVLPALKRRAEVEILGVLEAERNGDLLFAIQVEAPRSSKLKIVGITES